MKTRICLSFTHDIRDALDEIAAREGVRNRSRVAERLLRRALADQVIPSVPRVVVERQFVEGLGSMTTRTVPFRGTQIAVSEQDYQSLAIIGAEAASRFFSHLDHEAK